MTHRVREFIRRENLPSPCLVVDLDAVRSNYRRFEACLPGTEVFYAVKANPAPEILSALAEMGSNFDCASVPEIRMALAAGATPTRISYGNTIKKERDVAAAFALGVGLYAVDCIEEVMKVSRAAPGASVFCRILTDGEGAEWPLSRKFGCDPKMALDVLDAARAAGLDALGVSFHVGSQMTDPEAWEPAIRQARWIFDKMMEKGVKLGLLNLGGGFPARYTADVPQASRYGECIAIALATHFGDLAPRTIIEPGRGMVGDAGVIKSEVILVSRKSDGDDCRWVFLDVGKFGGLAETMDEAIRYPIVTDHDGGPSSPCVLAGPTCDSADVLYERCKPSLPLALAPGDRVFIESAGAYTTTYSAVAFNGFEPLATFVV
jgi:ornithine decarboxylase